MIKLLFIFLISISLNGAFLKEKEFNELVYVKAYGNPNHEPIVFVHGLGDDASTIWEETIEKLKYDYYILTFDFPGFGRSTKSGQLYSPTKYAKFINNLVEIYMHKPFHLVGHSMGGAISLKYASLYENKLKSLFLVDPAGILSKASFVDFLVKSQIDKYLGANTPLAKSLASLPQALESIMPIDVNYLLQFQNMRSMLFRSNTTAISAISLAYEDFSNVPQNLHVNTRIIWGEDDIVAPVRTGYALYKLMPNVKLNVIKNSKHVPIRDSFDIYFGYLQEHLKNPKYTKNKKSITGEKRAVVLNNENNKIISGKISNLEVYGSKNIIIRDAIIDKFTILDSSIKIENSQMNLDTSSYVISSRFEITACDISLKNGIYLFDSIVDLAAVYLSPRYYIFRNLNQSEQQNIVFSLSKIYDDTLHGEYILDAGQSFLLKK